MQLIGMLDSPYVRRTAIALRLMGLPFEHRSLSVFSTFEQFRAINPVVKAPSLVCDDGTVLMDSTLILDYAAALAGPGHALMPAAAAARKPLLRILGLAMAACDKGVQMVYEQQLRPPEKQHEPWLARVRTQLLSACEALEQELRSAGLEASSRSINLAGVSTAVTWQFLQAMLPTVVVADNYPTLRDYAARAERLPEFLAFPADGPGVPSSP